MPEPSALERAAASQTGRDNQLRWVLNVLARQWKMVAGFTLAGALVSVLGGMFWQRTPKPAYTAQTHLTVQPSRWEQGILKNPAARPIIQSTPEALTELIPIHALAEDIARAMVEDDLSRGGPMGAVATDDEYAAKAADIQNRLTLEPLPRAGRIKIAANAATAEQARELTEFAARRFIELNRRILFEEEKQTHDFVQEQLEVLRKRIDQAESKLRQLHREMGFKTREQVTEEIQKTRQQITDTQTSLEEAEARMAEIEQELQRKNEQLPKALGQINDAVITQLLRELDELVLERTMMGVVYEDAYPPLQDLEARIQEKRDAIRAAIQQIDAGIEAGTEVWQERQGLRRQYTELQLQQASLSIRLGSLKKLLEEKEETLPALNQKSKEYEILEREATQLRREYARLIDIEFDVRTAINRGSGQVERMAGIQVSSTGEQARPYRALMHFPIGALVGFLLSFALAVVLEMNNTAIRSIDDVVTYLNLEVIGTIPMMRFGKGRKRLRSGNYVAISDEGQVDACIVTQHDPKSPISEAYKALRTNFQIATMQQHPKTVMVTSTVPGEGKTTTAVNMAVALADSGKRVLIIDTDLRRPHVHHVMKMDRGPGLADVLREGSDYRAVVRQTRIQNLSIITSGRVPPNPSELIGSQRMLDLMKKLGDEFDLVICDAPSILVVTDPVLLSRDVDTVVLVVAADNARRETIMRGKQLLETAQANVAGVVLNGLEATRRHYYYYYYYYEDSSARRRRWIHI